MKLLDAPGTVQTSNVEAPASFKISATRKAFEILSSGLYSDKIAAVIRELSANAADSHTAASNTQPFKIHLPNTLEPFFSVTDYGTGLSEEDVYGLYTTYFDSDRCYSNDFTGCMGLGSKSPFSYTDQFTVESRHEGKKAIYNCHLDEKRIPKIVRMSLEDTTDPNGLTITIAVKDKDYSEFCSKAATILSIFNPKPEVVGNKSFIWLDTDYILKTADFGLMRSKVYHDFSRIIMGNVGYRLDVSDLADNDDDLKQDYNNLIGYVGIDLFLPLGSVDVAASREKLQYTPDTKKFIVKRLDEALDVIRKDFDDKISKASSFWAAHRSANEIRQSRAGSFAKASSWNGRPLLAALHTRQYSNVPKITRVRSTYDKPTSYETNVTYLTDMGIPVFVNDVTSGAYARVYKWLHDNNKSFAYLLDKTGLSQTGSAHSKLPDIKETGLYDEEINVSTLPEIPKPVAAPAKPKVKYARFVKFDPNPSLKRNSSDWWLEAEKKLDTGGVWVEIYRFYATGVTKDGLTPYFLQRLLTNMETLSKKPTVVYGARPADVKKWKLQTAKGWKNLKEYLYGQLDTMTALKDKAAALRAAGQMQYYYRYEPFFKAKYAAGSLFAELMEKTKEAHTAAKDKDVSMYISIVDTIDYPLFKGVKDGDKFLANLEKRVFEKYPMLGVVDWESSVSNKVAEEKIRAYIDSIDNEPVLAKAKSA